MHVNITHSFTLTRQNLSMRKGPVHIKCSFLRFKLNTMMQGTMGKCSDCVVTEQCNGKRAQWRQGTQGNWSSFTLSLLFLLLCRQATSPSVPQQNWERDHFLGNGSWDLFRLFLVCFFFLYLISWGLVGTGIFFSVGPR